MSNEPIDKIESKKLSITEKLFWITILVLFIIYTSLQIVAYTNVKKSETPLGQGSVVAKEIVDIVEMITVRDDTIQKNLTQPRAVDDIKKSLTLGVKNLTTNIDESVDKLFVPIYGNVDSFLDFHYSVIGEYSELGAAVTGKIEQTIQEKIFGSDFADVLESVTEDLQYALNEELATHQSTIDYEATKDIDRELNADILNRLKVDIAERVSLQTNKIVTLLGVGVGYKMVAGILSTKIAAKLSSKLAIKGAVKAGSKAAGAGAGAAAGLLCGPGVIICAPLLALGAWFGTDAILVTGDEYLHRDEFKSEIIVAIDGQKQALKEHYYEIYIPAFTQLSDQIVEQYRVAPVEKRIKKRVKEHMESHI
ncbi:MAG: hypothetical protein U9R27_08160 [Campylobacterota bacterium]|nr:hypothetical protein [Campylobacterota bacterium]